MRKLLLVLTIAVVVVLVVAAPAFARPGGYWTLTLQRSGDEGIINGAGGTVVPSATAKTTVLINPQANELQWDGGAVGTPHRGYDNTTGKCRVCHAVHGAGMTNSTGGVTTERLLRSTVNDACSFCHLTGGFATNPYAGGLLSPNSTANYEDEGNGSGHFSEHENTGYDGCNSCHAVHGANTMGTGVFILKNDPAQGVTSASATNDTGWGSFAAPVTNQTQFCQDCHDGTKVTSRTGVVTPINTDALFTTYFSGCNTGANATTGQPLCHSSVNTNLNSRRTQFGVTFTQARNGRSHVMTTQQFNDQGTRIAWHSSSLPGLSAETPLATSCAVCHEVDGVGNFPHFAANSQELIAGYDSLTHIDGVCISCHVNGTAGVGKTF